jgi:hypothetical protein
VTISHHRFVRMQTVRTFVYQLLGKWWVIILKSWTSNHLLIKLNWFICNFAVSFPRSLIVGAQLSGFQSWSFRKEPFRFVIGRYYSSKSSGHLIIDVIVESHYNKFLALGCKFFEFDLTHPTLLTLPFTHTILDLFIFLNSRKLMCENLYYVAFVIAL